MSEPDTRQAWYGPRDTYGTELRINAADGVEHLTMTCLHPFYDPIKTPADSFLS